MRSRTCADVRVVASAGRWVWLTVLLVGSVVWNAPTARAAISGMTQVASGLTTPIFVTHAPGDRSRLFVVQRGGAIRIVDLTTPTPTLLSNPFLTIGSLNQSGEGGFLGMAFHPNYATNGKFYTYTTHSNPTPTTVNGTSSPFRTEIRQYSVSANPNIADPAATTVLNFPRPDTNHVGGWIGFSPKDGYLYIASGDGGGSDDNDAGHVSGGNAQDTVDNLFGKMLRLDVDDVLVRDDFPGDANRNYRIPDANPFADVRNGDRVVTSPVTGDDEIWAYGLRNPFRDSFDRATGDLWIGDVGQSAREEVDFQPNGVGGRNFGWRVFEGTQDNAMNTDPVPANHTFPVYEYPRTGSFGGPLITGGYVYRGPDPSLQGKYFFLDSGNDGSVTNDKYWTFDPANPSGTVASIATALAPPAATQFPVSFGEDADGNLYIAYIQSGTVYRINTNQLRPGDFNADAKVDGTDLAILTSNLGIGGSPTFAQGNANGDTVVDGRDFMIWQQNAGYSALNVTASTSVPEPAAASLLMAAVAWMAGVRRRSRG